MIHGPEPKKNPLLLPKNIDVSQSFAMPVAVSNISVYVMAQQALVKPFQPVSKVFF